MTNDIFSFNTGNIDKWFVGADKMLKNLATAQETYAKATNWPPYNIVKIDENNYTIELAVAGFGQSDLDIEIDGGKLVVRGKVDTSTDESTDSFLHRGIATRAFTRAFAIDDHIEVKNAELFNGMLKIALERLVPEEKKPKKVPVKSRSEKQLLTETV